MKLKSPFGALVFALILLGVGSLRAHRLNDQDGNKQEIRKQLKDNAADFWIYDDLNAGTAMARRTGKPLLVSFR